MQNNDECNDLCMSPVGEPMFGGSVKQVDSSSRAKSRESYVPEWESSG